MHLVQYESLARARHADDLRHLCPRSRSSLRVALEARRRRTARG